MDGRRFDDLTRALGSRGSRRGFLKGLLGAGLAAAGFGRLTGSDAGAQVTQAYCGNVRCGSNPGKCEPGCVCCVYPNGNSRCRPPGTCAPGEAVCAPDKFLDPVLGCVDCLTADHCPGPTDGNACQVAACVNGTCSLQPGNAGAACGQTTCSNGAVTPYACDTAGACAPGASQPCDPFVCAADGATCRQNCTDDTHCVASSHCNGSVCVGDLELGSTCTRNSQCRSSFCTDGVCCSQAACGNCEVCGGQGTCVAASEGAVCTPSDACFREGRCTSGGICIAVGAPRDDCPAGECEQGYCENGSCRTRPVPGEPSCGPGGECFSNVCRNGTCDRVPSNENQSCSGGSTCNPNVCISGNCRPAPDRANGSSCPGGLCLNGACCLGAHEQDTHCPLGASVCCESAPCCGPGGCCVDCFGGQGSGGIFEYTCCLPEDLCPRNDPNARSCCYSDETCMEIGSGHACIDDRLICGGTTVCADACCGDSCCTDGQYCQPGGGCASIPSGSCISNADCLPGLACTGVVEVPGPNGLEVVQEGSCCPSNRVCPNPSYNGPGSGPQYYCSSYGQRCGMDGMTCSYAYYLSCSGTCNCSPRGGRTRL